MTKTTREIAEELSVEKHRVKYAIQKLSLEKVGEHGGAFLYDDKAQEAISEFIQQLDGENPETDSVDNSVENELESSGEIVRVQSERIEDLKQQIEFLQDALNKTEENLGLAQKNLERQQTLNFNDQQKLLAYEEVDAEKEKSKWWRFWK